MYLNVLLQNEINLGGRDCILWEVAVTFSKYYFEKSFPMK